MPLNSSSPVPWAAAPPILTRERVCHAVADRFLGLSSPEEDAVADLLVSLDPASQAEAAAAKAYLVYLFGDECPADRYERLTGRPFGQ